MYCPKCATPNPDTARYCSQCGFSFFPYTNPQAPSYVPPQIPAGNDKTIKWLLLFVAWIVLVFIGSDVINYLIDPLFKAAYGDTDKYWRRISQFDTLYGWLVNRGSLAIGTIALIKIPNRIAKWLL